MLDIIKRLKPYSLQIFIIFILLFTQAMTDLALPGYMADIVNIGVQQGGIKNSVPEIIRKSEMSRLRIFIEDSEWDFIDSNFILINKLSSGYEGLVKKYPLLDSEELYLLNTQDKSSIEKMGKIFNRSEMIVYLIETNNLQSLTGGITPEILKDVDIFKTFYTLPLSQQESIRNMILERTANIPDLQLNQTAVVFIKNEYNQIGLDAGRIQINYVFKVGSYMILLSLLGVVCSLIVAMISARVAASFSRDTRKRIFKKIEGFSNAEFDKFSTASLITRSTNDITQIQMVLIMMLRLLFFAPIIGVGGIIRALGEDVSMSWVIAASVLSLFVMMFFIFAITVPKFSIIQKLVDRLNLVTREMLTGMMVVRAFNTQENELKRFDRTNVDVTNINLFLNKVMSSLNPVMILIMNGVMVIIIWFGAKQIDIGNIQVGNMMAFMQYTLLILMAFMFVTMLFIMLPRASVSAKRINEVLAIDPSIADPVTPGKFDTKTKGAIEFQKVSFKYPDAEDYVLKNITFSVKPGQTTAFIGGTGSGKSTIISLLLRFYDVTDGNILIDNQNIRNVLLHELREKMGYVPQKSTLFSGTVESNIKYGNDSASSIEMEKAATIAQAIEFITSSENGFNTEIAQGGSNLSGGQKQRLSIARALAKKPEIYIFDDSFSALDFKTDAELRRALKKEIKDATVLIVGQRISTIMNADNIVVLEEGVIAGIGTHKELMENCGVYRELAQSQLTKEELA
jgi:ATP-binding cassette, subfamily B, multidrug efflux pump